MVQAILRTALLLGIIVAGCGAPGARQVRGAAAEAIEAALAGGTESFSHVEWDRLLAGGIREGLVDYRFMQEHRGEFDDYLAHVADAQLDRLAPPHLEALLVNAYNAYTIQAILDNPEVASIREIPGVWKSQKHRVGTFDLTLDEIEHRILRPFFKDPRIHSVVNCASMSCAQLPPWAVTGERIDQQLEERTTTFLKDPRNARVEGGRLVLSKYFDWYGSDYTADGWRGAAPSVAAYVARYAGGAVAEFVERHGGDPPIAFDDYDWSLNASVKPR